MYTNQEAPEDFIEKKKDTFIKTVQNIYEKIFDKKTPGKISITLMEALLVGVARNLDFVESADKKTLQNIYADLKNAPIFSETSMREGLSSRNKVRERLDTAVKFFSKNDH